MLVLHPGPSTLRSALLLPLASSLALVVLVAPAARADKRPAEVPPLIEEIQVEVVNVDVVVTDSKGNPVPGLTADDFVLYEDGERREITNFYAFEKGRTRGLDRGSAPGAGVEDGDWPDTSQRRRMALLFDSNSLEKRSRDRAIDAVERFVLEQFDGTYEWAVIAYGDKLQHLQPFTADKTTVLAALSRVRDLPVPVRRTRAGDKLFVETEIVKSRAQGLGPQRGNSGTGPRQLTTLEFGTRERMLASIDSFSDTTAALVQTMRAFSGLPGRKSLVLVSGGLDALPSAAQLFGRGFPGAGSDDRTDPMTPVLFSELLKRFELIVKTANASGFAIYPISSLGYTSTKAPYLDVERTANLAFNGGFESMPAEVDTETAPKVLAEGTGGEYYSSSRFYRAVDDIDNRTANAYVLGFRTTREPDRKYHRLKVTTQRPGLQVQSREGYLHLTRQDRLIEELSTPLTFPKDRGDFEVAIEVMAPEKVTKKRVDVTVAGVVPLTDVTLIPQGEDMVGRIYLYLAIYDEKGDVVGLFRERQDVRIPASKVAAAPDDVPARFGLTLRDLARGSYTLSLTVMDEISDRYGTGLQPVQL